MQTGAHTSAKAVNEHQIFLLVDSPLLKSHYGKTYLLDLNAPCSYFHDLTKAVPKVSCHCGSTPTYNFNLSEEVWQHKASILQEESTKKLFNIQCSKIQENDAYVQNCIIKYSTLYCNFSYSDDYSFSAYVDAQCFNQLLLPLSFLTMFRQSFFTMQLMIFTQDLPLTLSQASLSFLSIDKTTVTLQQMLMLP